MRILTLVLMLMWAVPAMAQGPAYQIEKRSKVALSKRFTPSQIALLEKLNRADSRNLGRLPELVVPISWELGELAYSPLPRRISDQSPKLLIVHQPGQMFGAYEFGNLVRWGPVNSGRQSNPTPSGSFALNWRSKGRHSSINPAWFMKWYFNFESRRGLAFHEYALPGRPASHACVRMLARDAIWLYGWGEGWVLDSKGRLLKPGTPVRIISVYNFSAAPPWRSLTWLSQPVGV